MEEDEKGAHRKKMEVTLMPDKRWGEAWGTLTKCCTSYKVAGSATTASQYPRF